MRTLATVIILLFGVALIVVHQRYNSAISRAIQEESTPVPVPLGPIDTDHASVRFRIENVKYNQLIEMDGHRAMRSASDWTVFDCIPESDPGASFRLALSPTPPITGQMPLGSTDAVLWVNHRDAGVRLVSLLSDAFEIDVPARRKPLAGLQSLKIGVSVLGQHLAAGDARHITTNKDDSLDAKERGPWTATRWFIEDDGMEAEVWFNYDLDGGRGEIVRKNRDDVDEFVQTVATALRDGPRPPRTPEDDPSLTYTGPHVGDMQRVTASSTNSYFFTANGSLVLMSLDPGTGITLVDPAKPEAPTSLIRLEGMVASILCGDTKDTVFIVQESANVSMEGMAWWQSPQRLWRVDRKKDTREVIDGPWGESGSLAGPSALSPDGRYLIISHRRYTEDGQRIRATYIHDFTTGRAQRASYDSSSEVVEWRGGGDTGQPLRCLVITGLGFRYNPDFQRQSYLLDPATGEAEPIGEFTSFDQLLSPDKKLRADLVAGDRVKLLDASTGDVVSSFLFHEDDRRYARDGTVSWLTPQYLLFRGKRLATIDVKTLKMCYLSSADDLHIYQFNRDFTWAATTDEDGLHVAPVVVSDGRRSRSTTRPVERVTNAVEVGAP